MSGFSKIFPRAEILSISDVDSNRANCLACEIEVYKEVDILVAAHGAGITNIIFMRPGSMLLEIVGVFDGRMLPVCGYHGPLAAIVGVHHALYYYDWRGFAPLNATEAALQALQLSRITLPHRTEASF